MYNYRSLHGLLCNFGTIMQIIANKHLQTSMQLNMYYMIYVRYFVVYEYDNQGVGQ